MVQNYFHLCQRSFIDVKVEKLMFKTFFLFLQTPCCILKLPLIFHIKKKIEKKIVKTFWLNINFINKYNNLSMKFNVYYLTVKIPVSYFQTKFFLPFPLYPRTDFS